MAYYFVVTKSLTPDPLMDVTDAIYGRSLTIFLKLFDSQEATPCNLPTDPLPPPLKDVMSMTSFMDDP